MKTLALLLFALCPALALGQVAGARVVFVDRVKECDGQRCRVVEYRWVEWPGHEGRLYLERERVTIGGWYRSARHWRKYDAATRTWGQPEDCAPIPVPEDPPPTVGQVETEEPENFGLAPREISGQSRWSINGRPCSREQQFEALAAGGDLVDDSKHWHLTIVGTDGDRRRVVEDLDNALPLAEWKGKLHVQALAPTHWAVEHRRLRPLAAAGVTIFVRAPDGAELLRIDGYQGAEDLAGRLRRLREPDKPAPLDGLRDLSAATAWLKRNWLLVAAAVAVAAIALRRRST